MQAAVPAQLLVCKWIPCNRELIGGPYMSSPKSVWDLIFDVKFGCPNFGESAAIPSSSPRPKAKPPPYGMAATAPPRKMPPVAKAAAAAAASTASTAPPAPMRNPTTTAVPPKSSSYKAPPGPLVYKQPPAAAAAAGMPSPSALAKGVRGVKAPPGPRPNGEGEREMDGLPGIFINEVRPVLTTNPKFLKSSPLIVGETSWLVLSYLSYCSVSTTLCLWHSFDSLLYIYEHGYTSANSALVSVEFDSYDSEQNFPWSANSISLYIFMILDELFL